MASHAIASRIEIWPVQKLVAGDRMTADQFRDFLARAFSSYLRIVKPEVSLYVCHPSSRLREFQNALEASGFNVRRQACLMAEPRSLLLGWIR